MEVLRGILFGIFAYCFMSGMLVAVAAVDADERRQIRTDPLSALIEMAIGWPFLLIERTSPWYLKPASVVIPAAAAFLAWRYGSVPMLSALVTMMVASGGFVSLFMIAERFQNRRR